MTFRCLIRRLTLRLQLCTERLVSYICCLSLCPGGDSCSEEHCFHWLQSWGIIKQSDSVQPGQQIPKSGYLRRVQAPFLEIPASWGAAEKEYEEGVPSTKSYSRGPKCVLQQMTAPHPQEDPVRLKKKKTFNKVSTTFNCLSTELWQGWRF